MEQKRSVVENDPSVKQSELMEKFLRQTNLQSSALERMSFPQINSQTSAPPAVPSPPTSSWKDIYDEQWVKDIAAANEKVSNVIENVNKLTEGVKEIHTDLEKKYNERTSRINEARQSRQASTLPSRTMTQRDSSRKWWNNRSVKKVVDLSEKSGKVFKWAGRASDIVKLRTTKPGDERNEAIGELIGSSIFTPAFAAAFSFIPVPGATFVGGLIGDYVGKKAGGYVGKNFNNIKDWTTDTYNQADAWARDAYNQVDAWATDAYNQVDAWATDTYNQADAWARDAYNQVDAWATDTYNQVDTWATGTYNQASDVVSEKFNEVTDKVEHEFNYAINSLKSAFWGGGKKDEPEMPNIEPYGPPKPLTVQDVKIQEWIHQRQNYPMYPSTMSPFPAASNPSVSAQQSSPSAASPINVNLPAGAVQLSVSGTELNYGALSAAIGAKLGAAISQAMENRAVAAP
ncbi:hypothetical protein [Cohnella cholangitidis]|uniref:Uncharacterized protein n=1 Tax=Cohnella cholangitidis TaxID=2598458 RepID=A0A7G5C183_9BACL|nr:hypothetical protein [Cohnella cholangitidis]QMV42967.1 hypothetical protein FPL14_18570 [Cohnella cholangitidis]